MVLYILIAAVWCVLALLALAICRLAALSDDAHAVELSDHLLAARLAGREQTDDDTALEDTGEARRATG